MAEMGIRNNANSVRRSSDVASYGRCRAKSNWVFDSLYAFQIEDGGYPHDGVILGHDGELYGTNPTGGQTGLACETLGCGTVYRVHPGPTAPWNLTLTWQLNLVYPFTGTDQDGGEPTGVIQDAAGNLYGGDDGGVYTCGLVYELSRSGGSWTFTNLYNGFYCPDGNEGIAPGGLVFDTVGNLYGATFYGGPQGCTAAPEGCGTVFRLTPTSAGWVETTLHELNEATDGALVGGLVMDHAGNIYGGTETGGPGGGGTIWELSPSNGGWVFNVIYSFQDSQPYSGPQGRLAIDAAGNLYGATDEGTYSQGNVFKLSLSNDVWQYTDLYDFTGGNDGAFPLAGPTLDARGNLYGTASYGGPNNYGNVWTITP